MRPRTINTHIILPGRKSQKTKDVKQNQNVHLNAVNSYVSAMPFFGRYHDFEQVIKRTEKKKNALPMCLDAAINSVPHFNGTVSSFISFSEICLIFYVIVKPEDKMRLLASIRDKLKNQGFHMKSFEHREPKTLKELLNSLKRSTFVQNNGKAVYKPCELKRLEQRDSETLSVFRNRVQKTIAQFEYKINDLLYYENSEFRIHGLWRCLSKALKSKENGHGTEEFIIMLATLKDLYDCAPNTLALKLIRSGMRGKKEINFYI